jgi:4-amino-4-deoxy-L-arabinose transferase-like glycosyltransferase
MTGVARCTMPRDGDGARRILAMMDEPTSSRRPGRRHRAGADRAWVGMFLVALGLRVAYAWLATGPHSVPYGDSVDYDTLAWRLATAHGFTLGPDSAPYATAFRPPVLPWIVSLLYAVSGHRFFAAVLLQCLIGALVPPLLVELGRHLYSRGVGVIAGWLAAIHPLLVFFSGYLLTETTFVAAVLVAMLATVSWIKTPRPSRAAGAGLLWGVAALTRPTALLLPPLVALWAWAPLGLIVTPRDRVRQIALLLAGLVIAVAPWTVRNAIVLRAFVPVTTGGGHALLDSNNDIVWNDPALRGGALSVVLREPYASRLRGRSEPAADHECARMAREFLFAHVRDWPVMAGAKLARFWRLNAESATSGTWRRRGGPLDLLVRLADPLLVWSLVTWPFAIGGIVVMMRGSRRLYQALVPLTVLYFTLLAVVYWGALRTRIPAEPFLVLLSAAGMDAAWRWTRLRRAGLTVIETTTRRG